MKNNRTEAYKTILVLATAGLIAHFVFKKDWILFIPLGLMVVSLFSGWVAEKISWAWLKFGEGLGYVNSRIILGALFFIILTPIALLYRVLGKNTLEPNPSPEKESYFSVRNHKYLPKDLKNLW